MIGNQYSGGNFPESPELPSSKSNMIQMPNGEFFSSFTASLHTPSGGLYKTADAWPVNHMIAIHVPASDNKEAGAWRCVIDNAGGFFKDQPVLIGIVDGQYSMHNGANGIWLNLDGTVTLADGSILLPDGTVIMPDKSIVTIGGITIPPNRVTALDLQDKIRTEDGWLMLRDRTEILGDGTVVTPRGHVIKPDGSVKVKM